MIELKFLINLTSPQVLELVNTKKLSKVSVIPVSSNLMKIIKEYMEELTGYTTIPVIGVTKVLGEEGLEETWDSLNSLIPFKTGDFVLEFNMPSDMCTTMSYADFLEFNNASNFLPERFICRLNNEEHCGDDNEAAICPVILLKYCTRFTVIKDNWDKITLDFNDGSQLIKHSSVFGGGNS